MKTKGNIWMSADKDTKDCFSDVTLELNSAVTINEKTTEECWDLKFPAGTEIIEFDFKDKGGLDAICYIPKKAIEEFLKEKQ